MHTLLKRCTGIGALLTVFLGMAWLLPLGTAQQPGPRQQAGPVVRAVYEGDRPSAPTTAGAATSPAAAESVLLLRNGEMIQGRVTLSDDRYRVLVSGGQIYVKVADVQYHCRDIQEAYVRKRAILRVDNALDHLELSQWCIKAGLWEAAAQELTDAAALEPAHPLIPVLDRRLKVAAAAPIGSEPANKPAPVGPSPQELDRMVRGMPPKTVETFAQVIQPMLVNHCATAACHGPSAGNGFHLLRPPAGSPPSRLVTQRNLHAVLQWLNQDKPEASPLLASTTRPHGTAQVPIFTDHQVAQYRQLRDWCLRVAQADEDVIQASYNEPLDAAGAGFSAKRGSRRPPKTARHPSGSAGSGAAADRLPGAALEPGASNWDANIGPRASKPNVQRGAAIPSRAPADPFDPESFNRGLSPASAAGAPATADNRQTHDSAPDAPPRASRGLSAPSQGPTRPE